MKAIVASRPGGPQRDLRHAWPAGSFFPLSFRNGFVSCQVAESSAYAAVSDRGGLPVYPLFAPYTIITVLASARTVIPRYVMDTGKNVCDPVRAEPVRGNRFASDSPRFGSSRPGGVSVSQNFRPAFGHHERMLPLGRRQPVVGQDRPAVGLVDEDAARALLIIVRS